MQTQITKPGPVLREDGSPVAGYTTQELLRYDRKAIRAKPWRIKEWDYYQVSDSRYCLQMTYGHASYVGQVSILLFDFRKGEVLAKKSRLIPLPFGSMKLPASASRDSAVEYNKNKIFLRFEKQGTKRHLLCRWEDFQADVTLSPLIPHAMVINVPFPGNPRQFYYNHKINGMEALGTISWGQEKHTLVWGEQEPAYGLLDWGRGVWPFSNEWFWSSGSGMAEGSLLGFNLGCGFGDTSKATENIFFYEGKAHKLGEVVISHQKDWMAPWRLIDREGRCDLTMTPLYDRTTRDKALFVNNCCHQVFGLFNGTLVLDDGSSLLVEDLPAFAEHAVNNW